MRYVLELEYTSTATVEVEAESQSAAIRKWADGEYDEENIELDEELFGGIPWDLRKVKEV